MQRKEVVRGEDLLENAFFSVLESGSGPTWKTEDRRVSEKKKKNGRLLRQPSGAFRDGVFLLPSRKD